MFKIHLIHEVNIEKLQEKIDKLNKKAKKLNCPQIELNIIGHKDTLNDDNITVSRFMYVSIQGDPPKINDYEFIGTIQITPHGNIIKSIPGKEYPKEYREINNHCDHCGSNRKRNFTYIVKHTITGEFKVVGKSCLKDFLGHNNPVFFAELLEWLSNDEYLTEYRERTGKCKTRIELTELMAHVAYHVRENGYFISKTKAQENESPATIDIALNGMFPMKKEYKVYPTDQDYITAETVINWAKNITPDNNEYLHNIKIIALEGNAEYKNTGYAASIIAAYNRAMFQEQKQQEKANKKPSEYVGSIKQRIDLTLTYLKSFSYETEYGMTYIHRFIDNNDNIFVWRTNKTLGLYKDNKWFQFDINSQVKLKGTIKDHNEYREEKQTILTRCKVL